MDKMNKHEKSTIEHSSSEKVRKLIGILFYALAVVTVLILIKTELRKWFVFKGDASSANTVLFWLSLGAAILFGWIGSKVWPHKVNNISKSEEDKQTNK